MNSEFNLTRIPLDLNESSKESGLSKAGGLDIVPLNDYNSSKFKTGNAKLIKLKLAFYDVMF